MPVTSDTQMRTFKIRYLSPHMAEEIGTAVQIHQKIISDVFSTEFRQRYYRFGDVASAVEHIVSNVVGSHKPINSFDGFAHWPKHYVKVVRWPEFDLDIHVSEGSPEVNNGFRSKEFPG